MPRLLPSLVLCALIALALPARADTTATSSIAQLMVLEPGDASYKLFHGAVWLDHDKAQWNYCWGGLQSKGRELCGVPGAARVRRHRLQGQAVSLHHRPDDLEGVTLARHLLAVRLMTRA